MKKLINESVNRFLGWKLPANFAPDAGIMFKPNANTESPVQFQYKHEPTGTNLFRAGQAEAMLIHVAKPLTDKIETLESDLQLQTKVFIAACEDLALIAEKLGIDPEDGGASPIIGSITELKAQLADSKQVANDCRIVADDAIAEAKKYQWQPIETAPKDETLLGFVPHSMGGYLCPIAYSKSEVWFNASCADYSIVKPSHWKHASYPSTAAVTLTKE